MSNIAIIIPCYNESHTIGDVVGKSRNYTQTVIVVDDGSTDNSGHIAYNKHAIVLWQQNKGAGAATATGVQYILQTMPSVETIVTLDADGQHNPDDIPAFIAATQRGSVAIGYRDIRFETTPFLRWLGNLIFSILRNTGHNNQIPDGECGFRAYPVKVLKHLTIETPHFGYCEETALKCLTMGIPIVNIPITTVYGDDLHKYSAWKQLKRGFEIPYTILKWRWKLELSKW